MKRVVLSLGVLVMLVSCGGNTEAVEAKSVTVADNHEEKVETAVVYQVSTEETTVSWKGTKLTGEHHGVVSVSNGSVSVEGDAVVAAELTIDMSTIQELDQDDTEMAAKLVGHLMSADFFKVDSFPTATIKVTAIEAGKASADLTIKGITKAIEFPVTVSLVEGIVSVNADFTINRTDWGIVYGSGSFMDLAKDKTIDDNISFSVALTAKK